MGAKIDISVEVRPYIFNGFSYINNYSTYLMYIVGIIHT